MNKMKSFESTQIGGKGTVRRKKKTKGGHITPKLTNEEKIFNNLIKNINNLIKEINKEYIEVWNVYMDEWWYDNIETFTKKDFIKSKCEILVKIKENEDNIDEFIDKFIIEESNTKLLNINYRLYKDLFSEQGFDKMLSYIEDLETVINKKEYLDLNEQNDNTIEDIKKYHEILNLDNNSIPTKAELKASYYKLSRDNHPDKHPEENDKYTIIFKNINTAYKTLLNYYHAKKNKEILD